jgi:hypothetical protein
LSQRFLTDKRSIGSREARVNPAKQVAMLYDFCQSRLNLWLLGQADGRVEQTMPMRTSKNAVPKCLTDHLA